MTGILPEQDTEPGLTTTAFFTEQQVSQKEPDPGHAALAQVPGDRGSH